MKKRFSWLEDFCFSQYIYREHFVKHFFMGERFNLIRPGWPIQNPVLNGFDNAAKPPNHYVSAAIRLRQLNALSFQEEGIRGQGRAASLLRTAG
jgi:hypothetical protein